MLTNGPMTAFANGESKGTTPNAGRQTGAVNTAETKVAENASTTRGANPAGTAQEAHAWTNPANSVRPSTESTES